MSAGTLAHFLTLRSWDLGLGKFPVCTLGPTVQGMGQLWTTWPIHLDQLEATAGRSTWAQTFGSQCPNAWDLGPGTRHWGQTGTGPVDHVRQNVWKPMSQCLGPGTVDQTDCPGLVAKVVPMSSWDLGQNGTGPKKIFGDKILLKFFFCPSSPGPKPEPSCQIPDARGQK